MGKLIWQNLYDIGDDTIDSQHQELFEIANEFFDNKQKKDKKDTLRVILHKLSKYMASHFKDEEDFMEKISYPDIVRHKELHQKLIDRLARLIKSTKDLAELEENLFNIMTKAFIEHILTNDKKIKEWHTEFIRQRKKGSKEDETIILTLE